MALRLLKKSEIDALKNQDKAKEIQEGLKISRRVDSLRELHAKEEETLNKFRDESLAQIFREIDNAKERKDALENNIVSLELKLAKLLPGMEATRKELHELKNSLAKKDVDLDKKSKEIDLKEIDIAIALKDAKDKESEATTRAQATEELHKKAEELKEEAKITLINAQKTEDNAQKRKEEAGKSILLAEQNLISREKTISLKEEELGKKESELNVEKLRVEDREKTLEREIERIRKNRI